MPARLWTPRTRTREDPSLQPMFETHSFAGRGSDDARSARRRSGSSRTYLDPFRTIAEKRCRVETKVARRTPARAGTDYRSSSGTSAKQQREDACPSGGCARRGGRTVIDTEHRVRRGRSRPGSAADPIGCLSTACRRTRAPVEAEHWGRSLVDAPGRGATRRSEGPRRGAVGQKWRQPSFSRTSGAPFESTTSRPCSARVRPITVSGSCSRSERSARSDARSAGTVKSSS